MTSDVHLPMTAFALENETLPHTRSGRLRKG